ncbi:hypothetical protein Dimus_035484 [Dionaea muscipula]
MVFETFKVPPIDKQGAEPKRYDFFEENFLDMCQLKREQGVWLLEIGGIRRRDDEDEAPADEVQGVADVVEEVLEVLAQVSTQQKETTTAESTPRFSLTAYPIPTLQSSKRNSIGLVQKDFKLSWTELK